MWQRRVVLSVCVCFLTHRHPGVRQDLLGSETTVHVHLQHLADQQLEKRKGKRRWRSWVERLPSLARSFTGRETRRHLRSGHADLSSYLGWQTDGVPVRGRELQLPSEDLVKQLLLHIVLAEGTNGSRGVEPQLAAALLGCSRAALGSSWITSVHSVSFTRAAIPGQRLTDWSHYCLFNQLIIYQLTWHYC